MIVKQISSTESKDRDLRIIFPGYSSPIWFKYKYIICNSDFKGTK